MLPFFTAVSIERAPIRGGSSLPCLLTVKDERGNLLPRPYVVKIFTHKHREATCNEVFAHVLAREFDLNTPPAALIEVDISLIAGLRKLTAYANRDIEPGNWFGTQLLENALDWSRTLPSNVVSAPVMALIFAFDVLLRNGDRRMGKPNFFLYEGEPVLIDHELCLHYPKKFSEIVANVQDWQFLRPNAETGNEGHAFYTRLRKLHRKNGLDFGPFLEYLRILNPQALHPYADQLAEAGFELSRFQSIMDFLADAKLHPNAFQSLLKNVLQ